MTQTGARPSSQASPQIQRRRDGRRARSSRRPGRQLTTKQAPGTRARNRDRARQGAGPRRSRRAAAEANSSSQLRGRSPQRHRRHALQGVTPLATWVMVARSGRPAGAVPITFSSRRRARLRRSALHTSQLCLPPPDLPENLGGARFGRSYTAPSSPSQGVFCRSRPARGSASGRRTHRARDGRMSQEPSQRRPRSHRAR